MKFNIDREVKILKELKKLKAGEIWLVGEKFLPAMKWYRAVTFFTQDDVNNLHVLFLSWSYKNYSTIHHISSYFYGDYRRLYRNKASISLDLLVNIENQAFRQSVLDYHELMCQVTKIIGILLIQCDLPYPETCRHPWYLENNLKSVIQMF